MPVMGTSTGMEGKAGLLLHDSIWRSTTAWSRNHGSEGGMGTVAVYKILSGKINPKVKNWHLNYTKCYMRGSEFSLILLTISK